MSKGKKSTVGEEGPGRFSNLEVLPLKAVERDLNAGKYVDSETLIARLRENGSRPVPPVVMDYVCRMLGGQVPAPKGRKPREQIEAQRQSTLVTGTYYRYFDWLEARRKKYGLPNSWTRGAAAPSEVAARLTARRIFGKKGASWHSIRNLIRSRK